MIKQSHGMKLVLVSIVTSLLLFMSSSVWAQHNHGGTHANNYNSYNFNNDSYNTPYHTPPKHTRASFY